MYYLVMRVYRICPDAGCAARDIDMEPRNIVIERGTIDEMVQELLKYKQQQVGYFIADYWIER